MKLWKRSASSRNTDSTKVCDVFEARSSKERDHFCSWNETMAANKDQAHFHIQVSVAAIRYLEGSLGFRKDGVLWKG